MFGLSNSIYPSEPMLGSSLVLALLFLSGPLQVKDSAPAITGGCRDINTDVRYTVQYAHSEPGPKDVTILEWSMTGERTESLTVFSPVWDKPRWFSVDEVFTSHDLGSNWDSGVYKVSSPLLETEAGYKSPANPKIVYRRLGESGLYLRSEDGGKTWVLPSHFIEGVSSETFAARIGGSRSYHTLFTLLAVHPRQPLTIYASLEVDPWAYNTYELNRHRVSEVYVSEDGGENWRPLTDALQAQSGYRSTWPPPLGISPSNPSIMFGQSFRGLVKSIDGGQTWSAVGKQQQLHKRPLYATETPDKLKAHGLPPDYQIPGYPASMEVKQFLFDPTNSEVLYVVSNKGIHRTLDGGNSWVLLDLGIDEVESVHSAALNPRAPRMLMVGTKHGLFLSLDEGCHFREVSSPRDRPPGKPPKAKSGP